MAYRNRAKRAWRYLGQTTSNVAELEAVVLALSLVKDPAFPLTIHSDSTYVIGLLSRGWKAKENVELVRKVRLLLGRFADVRFVKVPGHAGVPANELVDQLAKEAAQTGQSGQA
jgi:ribonuclease HI